MKPKQLVSTGKVIWIEADGQSSSPIRFVLDDDKLYFLTNAKDERVPPLREGQRVKVVGHPLAKQTRAGEAFATVAFVPSDTVPRSVLLDLAGNLYDPQLSPDQNYAKLKPALEVAYLELL